MACVSGDKNYRIVKELLVAGADYNLLDCNGNSILHTAVKFEGNKVIELILDHC